MKQRMSRCCIVIELVLAPAHKTKKRLVVHLIIFSSYINECYDLIILYGALSFPLQDFSNTVHMPAKPQDGINCLLSYNLCVVTTQFCAVPNYKQWAISARRKILYNSILTLTERFAIFYCNVIM